MTAERRSSNRVSKGVAVVGIGCRLPGSVHGPEELWQFLSTRGDGIRPVPADRWAKEHYYDADRSKAGVIANDRGGFIDGVDLFDREFFGYFPAEASRIDPQQRLLLEVAHEAFEDAGVPVERLSGSRTSVFVGSFMYDYLCQQTAASARDMINPYVAMGTGLCSLANRISYVFDLKAPSMTVDTACSSSLVALHMACRSILCGEADMALGGGVNLILRPESSIMLSKAGFLNDDGTCKSFDAAANGYVRAEGAGLVLLKDLDAALRDGDRIYAVIRGSAVNHDGYVHDGYTVPSTEAQVAVLEAAYAEAGVSPHRVAYVEAHGPGTAVGDPIECRALGEVIGRSRPTGDPVLVGSIKSNIGHLEGAAGVAGFIKAVLVAHHRAVPSNLHFETPNPNIDFDGLGLRVADRHIELTCEGPAVVGVNSFGAGGTNAHVVIESPPQAAPVATAVARPRDASRPFVISAKSSESLRGLAQRYRQVLEATTPDLDELARALLSRRSRYSHSATISASSIEQLRAGLDCIVDGRRDPRVGLSTVEPKAGRKVAFMFSGQGGQWPHMGLQLHATEPVFAAAMDEIDRLFALQAGWSILEKIRACPASSEIDRTVVVQPAVMSVQIALARLLMHRGIVPEAVVGHSIGEVAAAHIAGAIDLEQAVSIIYHRSRLQDRASGKGRMLAAGVDEEQARKLLKGNEHRASIAAFNGPRMLAFAGDATVMEQIAQKLEREGIFNRFVRVDVPYHSHYMEEIEADLVAATDHVRGCPAELALYSSVTAAREAGDHLGGAYWYANVREPVRLTATIEAMAADGCDLFVEVGPHPVLARGAADTLAEGGHRAVVLASMSRSEPEGATLDKATGQAHAEGLSLDLDALFEGARTFVDLPKMPWNRERCWFEMPQAVEARTAPVLHPFLARQTRLVVEDIARIWDTRISVASSPFLRDHQVDGEVVFPATAHIETAFAVGTLAYPGSQIVLRDLRFESALILPDDTNKLPLEVRLEISSNEGDYHIVSRASDAGEGAQWNEHSAGRINFLPDVTPPHSPDLEPLERRFETSPQADVRAFYETVARAGLYYGPQFQCITRLWHEGNEIFAHVRLPEALSHEGAKFHAHPAVFDACLHTVFLDVHRNGDPSRVYLPLGIDRVIIHEQLPEDVRCHVRVTRNDATYLEYDMTVYAPDGRRIIEACGVTCKIIGGAHGHGAQQAYQGCYEYRFTLDHQFDATHEPNRDLRTCVIVGPASTVADELAQRLEAEGITIQRLADASFFDVDGRTLLAEALAGMPVDRRCALVYVPAAATGSGLHHWRSDGALPSAAQGLLNVAQAVLDREAYPRLVLVTSGGVLCEGDGDVRLDHAALVGVMRVLKNECPGILTRVVDLPQQADVADHEALLRELQSLRFDLDEFEIALRGGRRYVRMLHAVEKDRAEAEASKSVAGIGGRYRATLAQTGLLDSVEFRQTPPVSLAEGEVEIEVHAAALNFKDIVNGMGVLPPKAVRGGLAGGELGLEVTGRVVATGSRDGAFEPGQMVMARVAHGFAGRVVAPEHCVARLPTGLDPVDAAAIPVVFLTAHYGLSYLGRLSEGETVLIHSAAGGVGAAAIQIAKLCGAKIIATAGTREKRAYLRSLGIEHVFDSRSLAFYSDVMAATGGAGVDLVLNSLTGNFITQGMKCLAPFGRFIEVGKADIYGNAKLSMERLGENISVHVVDVDRMAVQKPALHRRLLDELVALFEEGRLEAPPVTRYPISRLGEAMRMMSRAAYVGKIVLTMADEEILAMPPSRFEARPAGSYFISGGTGGFGLEVAKWLADRGAGHLVLASRGGVKTEADRAAVSMLRARGVSVEIEKVDISDAAAVHPIFARFGEQWPALAGVVHAAGLLDDASIANMDAERFRRVFLPKALGAWVLHEAVERSGQSPELFVMLSSISSVLGLYGQSNYAAANHVLDSLAELRRAQGRPGTSLNLGVLGEYAGMSRTDADTDGVVDLLQSHGITPMPLADVLAKLEVAVCQNAGQRMTARFEWSRYAAVHSHLLRDSRFSGCIEQERKTAGRKKAGGSLLAKLAGCEGDAKLELLRAELAAALGRILDLDATKIDTAHSIDKLSLDSLMLNQLRNWILRNVDVNLPLIKLLKGPSVEEIAAMLLEQCSCESSNDGAGGSDQALETTGSEWIEEMGVEELSPWLIRGRGDVEASTRVFCFHSMGVGASLFTRFLLEPPAGCDLFAVQTPGRENRHSEPAADSLSTLVDEIVREIEPWLGERFVFWGHSFGGIVAYETLSRLRERFGKEPNALMVTGTVAPSLIKTWQNREVMLKTLVADNEAEYLVSLSRYVEDAAFIKAILPIMRKDTPLMMSYRHQRSHTLRCPVVAFGARQDDMVYLDEIAPWREETSGAFELVEVDGDHWFLNKNRELILERLRRLVASRSLAA